MYIMRYMANQRMALCITDQNQLLKQMQWQPVLLMFIHLPTNLYGIFLGTPHPQKFQIIIPPYNYEITFSAYAKDGNFLHSHSLIGNRYWDCVEIVFVMKGPHLCTPLYVRYLNTLRPRQNGRNFPDDVVKCIFLNGNVWIPNCPINNIQS